MGKKPYQDSTLNEIRHWTLRTSGGHRPALVIETEIKNVINFFKVYPRFRENQWTITDPKLFPEAPLINEFSGSWINIYYKPLEEIQIESLYWAVDADVLGGEFNLVNQGNKERLITLDLVFDFKSSRGNELSHLVLEGKNLLYGQIEDLHLICFVSGGPSPAPDLSPCLSSPLTFYPGKNTNLRWITILAESKEAGMAKLRNAILLSWKDEISRDKISRQDQLSVSTGNADMDFALKYSRCQAENLLTSLEIRSPGSNLQAISPLEGLLLMQALYPLNPQQIFRILSLVYPTQIDDKYPNSGIPEYPFFGELLWQIQQDHELGDRSGSIIRWIKSRLSIWFENKFDRDGDNIPEIESSYFLDRSDRKLSHQIDPDQNIGSNPYLESPGLSALLVNEIKKLRDLSEKIGLIYPPSALDKAELQLIDHINSSWQSNSKIYQMRDSDSHLSLEGRVLMENLQIGLNRAGISLSPPARIKFSLTFGITPPQTRRVELVIHGRDQNGEYRIERISNSQIQWNHLAGLSHSQTIYSQLDFIFIEGDDGINFNLSMSNSNQKDISQLFPLFGKIPDVNLAEILVKETIINPEKFWSPFGIRSYPGSSEETIHLPWNYLIIMGLLNYGYKTIAGDLFSRIMTRVGLNILTSGKPSGGIDSTPGEGLKPFLAAEALIPTRLLLQIAGVRISGQQELIIKDQYPFNFPLRLYYRGATLERTAKNTVISIPGKEKIIHSGTSELRVFVN